MQISCFVKKSSVRPNEDLSLETRLEAGSFALQGPSWLCAKSSNTSIARRERFRSFLPTGCARTAD
jgi:hypothetical protein